MDHALYNPFIKDLWIEEASENLSIKGSEVGEEDQPIRILYVGLYILEYDDIVVYEFQHLHYLLQIRNEEYRFPSSAVDMNFTVSVL